MLTASNWIDPSKPKAKNTDTGAGGTTKSLLGTYTNTLQFGSCCFDAALNASVSTKITEKKRETKRSGFTKIKMVENQGKKQQTQHWSQTKRTHEQGSYHIVDPEQKGAT